MARGERRSRDELDELSRLLLDLRERARMSQPDVAGKAGISQSMLSRMETGRKVPDAATAHALAQLYKSTPDERKRLIELITMMEPVRLDSRLVMQRGQNQHFQERIRTIEKSCSLLRAYHPSAILGSLQTSDYARAVFTAPRPDQPEGTPIDESLVAFRTGRFHQLAESNRQWTLIQGHAALEWSLGSPAVMAAQMDQLIETSRLPNVRLGIVPAYVPARIQAHHGFDIYDRRAVCIGTWTATALTIDPHDITEYEWLFGELEQLAVFDDEARTILARIAERYRHL